MIGKSKKFQEYNTPVQYLLIEFLILWLTLEHYSMNF